MPLAGPTAAASFTFAERFAADSAEAGLQRTLLEQRQRAERHVAEGAWEEALQAFEEAAHAAVGLGDRRSEAFAVLGMADCLSKPASVDGELVCGMYRYAEAAAEEVGDHTVQFRALAGRAALQRALRRFGDAEGVWETALSLARVQGQAEQISFTLTQLGLTLLQDPGESAVDVVNDSKESAGYLTRSEKPSADEAGVRLRSGPSQRASRAAKLLAEAVAQLPESAGSAQKAVARMNLAAALRRLGGSRNKRKAEQEMVVAYELLKAANSSPELKKSVSAILLEHYEDNMWLADGNPEAVERIASLRAQEEAAGAKQPQLVTSLDKGTPKDPEERYAFERALWARQKLRQLEAAREADLESDADSDASPACPTGTGWQR
mmetsp:Transcript_82737/g.229667  ORF Transcript_82737/g.229667 Transcript_82737/m.229667 type:complete len:380 (-) Transcript_82737:311-1450(-)